MAQISAFTGSEIRERTKKCTERFNQCLAHEQLGKQQWLETGLAEFNLWSLGLNAAHSNRSSLDYKIRQRPDLQEIIIDLLDGLDESLEECLDPDLAENIGVLSPEDNPESPLHFSVFNIKAILKQLTRLYIAIRKAGTAIRHHKADTSMEAVLKQNINGLEEFREDLTAAILVGLESWDPKNGLPTPLENPNEQVIKRLVNANVKRRNRIYFATEKMRKEKARQERKKQKQLVVVDPQVGVAEEGQAQAPERNPERTPKTRESTVEPPVGPVGPLARQGSFNEESQAPTAASTIPLDVIIEQTPSKVAGTTITKATSIARNLTYPSRPKWPELSEVKHIDCPYCSEPLTEEYTKNQTAWNGHVSGDILPYICFIDRCKNPDELYRTSEELTKHILSEHGVTCWICDECTPDQEQEQFEVFETAQIWREHLLKTHLQTITDVQFPKLAELSAHKMVPPIKCPLCDDATIEIKPNIDPEITRHIHQFSIRALPWEARPEANRSEEHLSGMNSDTSANTSRNRRANATYIEDMPNPNHEELKATGSKEVQEAFQDMLVQTHRSQASINLHSDLSSYSSRLQNLESSSCELLLPIVVQLDRNFEELWHLRNLRSQLTGVHAPGSDLVADLAGHVHSNFDRLTRLFSVFCMDSGDVSVLRKTGDENTSYIHQWLRLLDEDYIPGDPEYIQQVEEDGGKPNPVDITGLCLLSFDGGVVRGLSSLCILKSIMDRVNDEREKTDLPAVKPCEVFDLVGGTGTGGLIAIMIGRLEMDVDECIDAYVHFAETVFGDTLSSIATNAKRDVEVRFDSAKLDSAIRNMIENSNASRDGWFNDGMEQGCRTFVCTTDCLTEDIVCLRSYSTSNMPNISATICEAVLATISATAFFDPVNIEDRTFSDGAMGVRGVDNPVDLVEREAWDIWRPETGDLKPLVKCIISIGTGNPEVTSFENSPFESLWREVTLSATLKENIERKFLARWARHLGEKRYFRFNVDRGLHDVGLEEYSKKGLVDVATERYLGDIAQKFQVRDCIQNLRLKQSIYIVAPSTPHRLRHDDYKFHVEFHQAPDLNEVLNTLPIASDAPFNAYQRQHDPGCLPNTRVDLLQDIYSWANGQDERCIFWLNGLAATGKSTIARTVAKRYYDEKRLGASFFFSRGGGDVGHAGKFITSIAWQLASSVPSLNQYVYDAIKEHRGIANQSLRDQWQQLVLRPLSKLSGSGGQFSYILVVDALDECDNDKDIRIIVDLLAEAQSLKTARLRILLTSRPEVPIRNGFAHVPDGNHQDFVLHNISPSIVDQDIRTFLEYNFKLIARERSLGVGWPGEDNIKRLVQSASGLFIWATTACRFIHEGKRFAIKRLNFILENSSVDINAAEKHLNEIYTTVLRNYISTEYSYEEVEELLSTLKSLLGSIVTLLSPLSTQSLSKLLSMAQDDVDQTLQNLHAILSIPEDRGLPLRLHHPSFRDFLYKKARCEEFWVDEKQAHQVLADSCIQLMSASLKQYICGVDAPGTLVSDVERSQVDQSLPAEVQYACLYWVEHLQRSDNQPCDDSQVYVFLQEHLLHWLEALGWIKKISEGVLAISSLEAQIFADKSPNLYAFVHDAKRFALHNRSAIETTPLQVYYSALIFTPTKSIVREQFKKYIPISIKKKPKDENRSAILQTLEGHSSSVNSVAFSPDGRTLASGSDDNTVRVWDAVTGAILQTLEGHSDSVNSVAFSPDGRTLASGSDDNTVRVWDAVTGAILQTLEGHSSSVNSVAFSPDGRTLASGSYDKTVRLWDAVTGAQRQTLKGHSNWVMSVAFSPDGKTLASGSYDKTVRLWDAVTGAARQTLEGHFGSVSSVVFSPDGKVLASGSYDSTVRLWDAVTGAALQTLKGHSSTVRSVAFSPDGKVLASGSDDKTVRLWDAVTGAARQTLEGHSDSVFSVAFSPDGKVLASGSDDKTVRLWDAVTGAPRQTLEGHSDSVNSVAFSPDGKVLASGSDDKTVRLWDAVTGAQRQTLKGHSDSVFSVAFSPDGKVLASGSDDKTVRLWDAVTGAERQTLKGHSSTVRSVAFSPDGKVLASGSDDKTVRLWDAVTGAERQTLKGHSDWVNSVAFSPDGKVLASGSDDKTVRLWDAVTGAARQTLEGHSDSVFSVAFSPDGKVLASGSDDKTVRLWDAVTGAALQTLEGHSNRVSSVAFWDDVTGVAPQSLEGMYRPQAIPAVDVKGDWVTLNGQGILWLPPDYRLGEVAFYNRVIAIGCPSGRIFFLQF